MVESHGCKDLCVQCQSADVASRRGFACGQNQQKQIMLRGICGRNTQCVGLQVRKRERDRERERVREKRPTKEEDWCEQVSK